MSRITVLALLLAAGLSTACDSSSKAAKTPTTPDAPGAPVLEVRIKGGDAIPRTGYRVTVDGTMRLDGQTDFSVMFPGLNAGDHSVELTVISTQCRAAGENPRRVTIRPAETVVTEFEVMCTVAAPAR